MYDRVTPDSPPFTIGPLQLVDDETPEDELKFEDDICSITLRCYRPQRFIKRGSGQEQQDQLSLSKTGIARKKAVDKELSLRIECVFYPSHIWSL